MDTFGCWKPKGRFEDMDKKHRGGREKAGHSLDSMASLAMHISDTYLDLLISPVCAHTCACAMNMCGNQRTTCGLLLPGTACRLPALMASALVT